MRLAPGSPAFVALVGALSGLTAVSIDMSLPALPRLVAAFGTTVDRAQATISVFLLGYAASQLVYGPLSDRFGRRPVLLGGLAIYTAAGVGCALSGSIAALVAGRFFQGVGACVGPLLGRAIVRDCFERVRAARVLSSITLVMALGPLLGPLAGGYVLALADWPAIFVVLAAGGALLLTATWAALGETIRVRDPHALRAADLVRNYAGFLGRPACRGYALVVCTVFAGMFAYIAGSSFVFIEYFGLSTRAYGVLFATGALALMAGASVNRRLVARAGPEVMLRIGVRTAAIASLVLVVAGELGIGGLWGVMLPVVVYVFAFGIVTPNATAAALEPVPHMAGAASAVLGFLQMAGGALVSYAVGALYDGTPRAMSLIMAAAGTTTWLLHAALTRPARAGDGGAG